MCSVSMLLEEIFIGYSILACYVWSRSIVIGQRAMGGGGYPVG